jgi:hypothetical protein
MQLDDKKGNDKLSDKEKTIYMKTAGEYVNAEYEKLLKQYDIDELKQENKEALAASLELLKKEGSRLAREAVKANRK